MLSVHTSQLNGLESIGALSPVGVWVVHCKHLIQNSDLLHKYLSITSLLHH